MHFYSIIVPAHNEENYIERMLKSLVALDFPQDHFETIISENGSTDGTRALLKKITEASSNAGTKIRVITSEQKGVSRARNAGARAANSKSDWIIFIDADSALKPNFLKELDQFLIKNHAKKYAGGTAIIRPLEKSLPARFWYWVINLSRRFTKYPWVMQIMRHDLFGEISYDESISYGEDIIFYNMLHSRGKTFLLHTDQVETSVRRFHKIGWLRVLASWFFVWVLPKEGKKKKTYTVVR